MDLPVHNNLAQASDRARFGPAQDIHSIIQAVDVELDDLGTGRDRFFEDSLPVYIEEFDPAGAFRHVTQVHIKKP